MSQKVYEGRAELNVQQFLDSLNKMEASAKGTSSNLTATFKTLDQTLTGALSGFQGQLQAVAKQVSSVGKAVSVATAALRQAQQLTQQAQAQSNQQKRAADDAARARQAQSQAERLEGQRTMESLQQQLRQELSARQQANQQRLAAAHQGGREHLETLAQQFRQEAQVIQTGIQEQQRIRDRQLALAASAQRAQANGAAGVGVGTPSADAYNRAMQVAEQARLREQALARQLTSVVRAEANAQAAAVKQSADAMTGSFQQMVSRSGQYLNSLSARSNAAKEQFEDVENSLNSIYRAGSQLTQFGAQLTALSAGLTLLGRSLATNSGEFDFWVRRSTAAAKAAQEATGEMVTAEQRAMVQAEEFRERTLQIGRGIGVLDPAEIAEGWFTYQAAVGDVIRTEDDLLRSQVNVNSALRAAVITGEDASTVIRGTSAALGQFNLDSSAFNYVLALMANTTQVTLAEFGDMLEAMKMAGPQFDRLQMSIGDVAAAQSLLADVNIRGSQSGRLLSSGLTNLVRPTNMVKDALNDLFATQAGMGDSFEDVLYHGGELRNLWNKMGKDGEVIPGLLHQFYEASKEMTNTQREYYLASIFGKDAGRAWAAVVGEYARAEEEARAAGEGAVNYFERLAQAMNDPQQQLKAFGEQWEEVAQSTKVQMGQVTFAFQELGERLGVIVATQLIPFLRQVSLLLYRFLDWSKANPELANSLVKVGIALAVIAGVLGPVMAYIGLVVNGFVSLQLAGSALGFIFSKMAVGAAAIVAPLSSMFPLLAGLIGPIGLLVAVLGVLALAWYNDWFGMREVLGGVVGEIQNALGALGSLLYGLGEVLVGFFTDNTALIQSGGARMGMALLEGFVIIPLRVIGVLQTLVQSVDKVLAQMGRNMRVWGYNLMVSLANGMIEAGRMAVQAAYSIAESIARFFRSYSPPKFGPLRQIDVWGTNLVNTLIEGMQAADFGAITGIADQIGEALRSNIESGLVSPTLYASTMGTANNLIDDMLGIVRDGGRVGDDFFAELAPVLGEWYEYVKNIGLAYQEVYANTRQLDSERERLNLLRDQSDELDKQHQARMDAFDLAVRAATGSDWRNYQNVMVDPTSEEGKRKIAEMQAQLTAEEFQNWLNWQKDLWEQRHAEEEASIGAQIDAQEQVVNSVQAQLEAAQKQYELYVAMYDYAQKMYGLAEEQQRLVEQKDKAAKEPKGPAEPNIGKPEDLAKYRDEIRGATGADTVIEDESGLRERTGDDIAAYAEANRQREREENRLSELEKLNRKKRAEFEAQLINATSEEERKRINQEKDAWDAAYREESARLRERIQLTKDIQDAAEAAADASAPGRIADEQREFQEDIKDALGEQNGAIKDANALKGESKDLDEAQVKAREQLRDEERALRDLQALGDQKRLEFEQRIREAAKDPEKLRRIKEEQEAWEASYKTALEAQQARVEAARRASQDLQDEEWAQNQMEPDTLPKGGGAAGGGAPDFGGGGPGIEPPSMDFSQIWDSDGNGVPDFVDEVMKADAKTPRASELQTVKFFEDFQRGLSYLGDENIGDAAKLNNLNKVVLKVLGLNSWSEFFTDGWDDLGSSGSVAGFIWEAITKNLEKHQNIAAGQLEFFNILDARFNTWVSDNWTRFRTWADDTDVRFNSWVTDNWTRFRTWADDTDTRFNTWASDNWTRFKTWADDTDTRFNTWVTTNWNGFKTWADNVDTRFNTWVTDNLTRFRTWANDVDTRFNTWVTTNWNGFKKWADDVDTRFNTWVTTNWNGFKKWADDTDTRFNTWVSDNWTKFKTWADDTDARFNTWVASLGTLFGTWFGTGEGSLYAKVKGGIDAIVGAFNALTGTGEGSVYAKVNSAMSSISGAITGWISKAKEAVQNILSWFNDKRDNAEDEGSDGSHAMGLNYVPFDGYRAILHQGERVLTAAEASAYNAFAAAIKGANGAAMAAVTNTNVRGGSTKNVNINVERIDATNPDEGRNFLNRLAFLA